MANKAQGEFSHAGIEKMQHFIKKPHGEVKEEKKWELVFRGHRMLKAVQDCHPAMVSEYQADSCLSCPYGTAQNPHTRWRDEGLGAPTPSVSNGSG